MLPIENALLFVHIPKTAGTSFRRALKKSFGEGNMFYDYSTDNKITSDIVLDYIYPDHNILGLGEALNKRCRKHILRRGNKKFCLSGHFPLTKYAPLFLIKNAIVFFRDPIQRFISSYEHQKRFYGLDMSLEAYGQNPSFVNIQSKVVKNCPLGLIGFIGLQEHYADSLLMLQDLYQIDVSEFVSNVNKRRVGREYTLDEESFTLVNEVNREDVLLYEQIKPLFKQRQKLFKAGLPYTYGHVGVLRGQQLAGWAVSVRDKQAVEIQIKRNGNIVASVLADQYRPNLREKNTERYGFVGFNYAFPKAISEGDEVECVVAETQQVLPSVPLQFSR